MTDYVISEIVNENYVLYSIDEKDKARKRQVNTLVINGHGSFIPADSDTMPRLPPRPKGFLPAQFDAVNSNSSRRLSYLMPPAKEYQLRASLCLLGKHGSALVAGRTRSILHDLIECAIAGEDLYPPGRKVTDYCLSNVSDKLTEYGGRLLNRRDFAKVLLIEAMMIRQQEEASAFLRDMDQKYKGQVLIPVPDIAIITANSAKGITLSTVLESLPQYTTVFGHFCRGDRTSAFTPNAFPNYLCGGLVKNEQRAELEQAVLERATFLT